MKINKIILSFVFILIFFGIYCSLIIGISWDEPSSNEYALARLNFIKTFGENTDYLLDLETLNPGFYTFLLGYISNLFPENFIFEARHLINLFLSFFTLFGVYLIAKDSFDKRIGLLTVLFCLLNPFFFGMMSITVRDMPICFGYVWTVYFFLKYIENYFSQNKSYIIFLGLSIGFGMSARVPFIASLIPLFLFFLIFLLYNKQKIKLNFFIKKFFIDIIIVLVLSSIIIFSFWVGAYDSPIKSIIYAISKSLIVSGSEVRGASMIPTTDMIAGNIFDTSNTPRNYILIFLLERFPIFLIFLFLISIFILFSKNDFLKQKYRNFNLKIFSNLFIIFFPVLTISIAKASLFDGFRLLIFLIPFFSLQTAVAFNFLIENFERNKYVKILLIFTTVVFLGFFERYIRLTPYHYDFANYSNIFFKNSENSYQHDYWAISYKELVNKIKKDEKFRNKKFSISVCGGDVWQIVFEFAKDKNFKKNLNFYHAVSNNEADYVIMINRLGHKKYQHQRCFERFPGENIHSIEKLGVIYSVFRKVNPSP